MTALCLGDVLVDLVCEIPVTDLTKAESFRLSLGGVMANVAVGIARRGQESAIAGSIGDDEWARWSRERLSEAGVRHDWLRSMPMTNTSLAFVTFDKHGEPSYSLHGAVDGRILGLEMDDLLAAVTASSALVITSNTLINNDDLQATCRACEVAIENKTPIILDPNLRWHRWRDPGEALGRVRKLLPATFLVKCNYDEAVHLTGESDLEGAARSLLGAGTQFVVITSGERGAILRGPIQANVSAPHIKVRNTSGAGDAVTAVLVADLLRSRFVVDSLPDSLGRAVNEGARVSETWSSTL